MGPYTPLLSHSTKASVQLLLTVLKEGKNTVSSGFMLAQG